MTAHRKRPVGPARPRTAAGWRHFERWLKDGDFRDLYVGGRPRTGWERYGASLVVLVVVGLLLVACLVCGGRLSNGARCCCRVCWHDLLTRFHGRLTLAEAAAMLLWDHWSHDRERAAA